MLGHTAVGREVFTDAATQLRFEQVIDAPRAEVFRSLAGAGDWKHWLGLDVVYTSPEPHGVGTTRTVRTQPFLPAIQERFFIWDEDERLAFHFVRSPLPVPVFAEDYVLEDAGHGSTLLRWTIAVDGGLGPVRHLVGGAMQRMATEGLPKLAQLLGERAD